MDLVEGIMGNQPDSGQLTFYAPYSLGEFRLFYRKICSQLTSNQSKLLYELCKSSESDLVSHSNAIGELDAHNKPLVKRPLEEKTFECAKRKYLQGLLCGASLDSLELICDEFRLVKADARLIGNDDVMLFFSSRQRSLGDMIKMAERLTTEEMHCGAFVAHHVDRNDYALAGKRLPDDEYRKRLHTWELDRDWD